MLHIKLVIFMSWSQLYKCRYGAPHNYLGNYFLSTVSAVYIEPPKKPSTSKLLRQMVPLNRGFWMMHAVPSERCSYISIKLPQCLSVHFIIKIIHCKSLYYKCHPCDNCSELIPKPNTWLADPINSEKHLLHYLSCSWPSSNPNNCERQSYL